ncbi:MAG: class I SAM-dependent methyltransferase [Gammaproteobacteria bacterium]|nr:MAG: class I SAM-dependent methyltransferase [Gammaproteobacteria bacterium]
MQRIPEPELMDEPEQALAYASADFSEPNQLFVDLFTRLVDNRQVEGNVLDLGCGPGDICIRLAESFPSLQFLGIDGSRAMLEHAYTAVKSKQTIQNRVVFQEMNIPSSQIPTSAFDYVISNSLLHHLHDPEVLWNIVKHCSKPGALVLVMDLFRPGSMEEATAIVETYAGDEAAILKQDFFNSLCAAFTIEEVKWQLNEAGLADFTVTEVSDRHLFVSGRLTSSS